VWVEVAKKSAIGISNGERTAKEMHREGRTQNERRESTDNSILSFFAASASSGFSSLRCSFTGLFGLAFSSLEVDR
jgi:hypothetical protein